MFEKYQFLFSNLSQLEILKFHLSQGNINFLENKVDLLKELEQDFNQKFPIENQQQQLIILKYNTALESIQNRINPILSTTMTESAKPEKQQVEIELLVQILQMVNNQNKNYLNLIQKQINQRKIIIIKQSQQTRKLVIKILQPIFILEAFQLLTSNVRNLDRFILNKPKWSR
ncbi:unnamed protein product [Paramecium octaurelia]|uniref:Uncharacterized protein n=1 Tax=Paramecium octaurelia TaxID=43137 RepID=A0A8S1SU40_PAROT|nr:unnamed protein product [Paramecium octaurelia]